MPGLFLDGGLTAGQGFFDRVHIHFCGNGYLGFRPYGGSLLANAPKVTKRSLPHHSAPRLGSVCPHSGIAPWAAAKGHPWSSAAIPASMPGCPLRNACVRPSWLTGRRDQRPTRGGLRAGLTLPVVHPSDLWEQKLVREGGLTADLILASGLRSNVGASLLAKTAAHPTLMQADPPPSRASSLPQEFAVPANP
ncbi:hypothetical protein J2W43_000003 [Pseudomonas brassicacearum]|uniref:Uncharacterized protein n=1 Tax=Pseudomonas brassicacearum TaxID=930166 RepID=A0AAW8M2X0_9PSED|nr:hypothetical protein [Pseudomonas brassicacearum]